MNTKSGRAHAAMLVIAALATAAMLILTARVQIFDGTFVFLSEAAALLAGDHPYRDIFEFGAPLSAYLSAGAQLLAGYRLIGEFVLQWTFVLAGVLIAFHLGMTLSRSAAATLVVLPFVLLVLPRTAIYHYPKLFCVPLGIWLAWRYLERPGAGRAAALGIGTAIAFLFRHDLGLFVGLAAVLAVMLAWLASITRAAFRAAVVHAAAGLAAGAVLLAPWAIVVQRSEGLGHYVRVRTTMYEGSFGESYTLLRDLLPIRAVTPDRPPAERGTVGFIWQPHVDEATQGQLEQKYSLRRLEGRDAQGRLRYEVPNLYDTRLFELDPYINDGAGFRWERLHAIRLGIPREDDALLWIAQVTLLVPMLLIVAAPFRWRRGRRLDPAGAVLDAQRMALAGAVLMLANASLMQKPGYATTVLPLTAALGAVFLSGPRGASVAAAGMPRRLLSWAGRLAALAVVVLTTFTAVVWIGGLASGPRSLIRWREEIGAQVAGAFRHLAASPPVDSPRFRFLRECTRPGDRLLVTGMTPFEVSYLTQRPFAGGHVYWRDEWASDAESQARSLELLKRQSVPFAVGNREPVMNDFAEYKLLKDYLATHYEEVPGTGGQILVDKRRTPTGRFGPDGWPCFAE